MSLIKFGKCNQCSKDFYWSIGHPPGYYAFGFLSNDDVKKKHPVISWWYSFGNLCSVCAPEYIHKEKEVDIEVIGVL